MEMTRRHFGRLLAAAAVLPAAGRRALAAVRAAVFPGRVRAPDDSAMRRPGPWSG
jgi:hypothetical protein